MEKLEGKYFENTINKLKEAKHSENIEMRSEFKTKLRAGLVERAAIIPVTTDWSDLILRWKYLFGAVPALAVLTIVAINAGNFQVKMPSTELIPKAEVNEVSKNSTLNSQAIPDVELSGVDQNDKIVTFSAALVMPSADALAKARAGEQLTLESLPTSIESGVASPNADQLQPLNFLSDTNFIKLNLPKLDVFSFDTINNGKITVSTPNLTMPKELPATSDTLVKQNLNGPSVVVIPINNVTPIDSMARQENNARLEIGQKVAEPVFVNPNQALSTSTESNQTVQTNVVVPTASVQNMSTPINIVNAGLNPATTMVTPSTDSAKVMTENLYINSAGEALIMNSRLNLNNVTESMSTFSAMTYLDNSRIIYEGIDKPLITAMVMKEFGNRNGNLSGDYYIKVVGLEDGKVKISLFEFGKVKQIVFLQKDFSGDYKAVTVINY